jgi:hypothetical protein
LARNFRTRLARLERALPSSASRPLADAELLAGIGFLMAYQGDDLDVIASKERVAQILDAARVTVKAGRRR